jgi:hypothetical protein
MLCNVSAGDQIQQEIWSAMLSCSSKLAARFRRLAVLLRRVGIKAMSDKVTATSEALRLLAEIVADHGPVLFHQSGGCCDGSSPMCYPQGDFIIGDNDVKLGEIGGAPFYISGPQYEVWKHTDLIIDVVPGRGGMFSLDNGRERRFLTRSTICAAQGLEPSS